MLGPVSRKVKNRLLECQERKPLRQECKLLDWSSIRHPKMYICTVLVSIYHLHTPVSHPVMVYHVDLMDSCCKNGRNNID